LEEGLKIEKELVEREHASLRATNETLHKRLCDTLEQSNGVATENLIATQTAAQFAVEIKQYRNQVEFLERTVADQKVELKTLRKLAREKATELHTLRRASSRASYVGTTSLSALLYGSSPYLNKPKSCQPWRKHTASAASTAASLGNAPAASRSSSCAGRGHQQAAAARTQATAGNKQAAAACTQATA
jgi:hypothetical protein